MPFGPTREPLRLRLYIAGGTPRSHRAVRVVRRVVQRRLDGRCDLEVIDVYRSAARARDARVIGVPMLVREGPGPEKRLMGELGERAVADLLEVEELPAAE